MFAKSSAIILLTVACNVVAKPSYEKNPFLVGVPNPNEPSLKPKQDINQWNVAVVLPPGGQLPQQPPQSGQPPTATSPGYVWLQVPASYFQNKPGGSQKPLEVAQPKPPTSAPSKENSSTQNLFPSNPFLSTGVQQPVGPVILGVTQPNPPTFAPPKENLSTQNLLSNNPFFAPGIQQPVGSEILGVTQPKPPTSAPPKENLSTQNLLSNNPFISPGIQQPIGPIIHTTQVPLSGGEFNKKCVRPTGQFPSSVCNKFINCWNGVAVEQACPEGLLFSAKGHCDYPENVDCNERPVTAVPPQIIIPQGPTIGSVVQTTQAPTSVSPTLATPQGSESVNLPAHTTQVPAPTGGELNRKCLKPRGQFPSNACNKFLNCWNGIATEQACPEGLLFNAAGYCDFAENVNCAGKPIEGSPPASAIPVDVKSSTASPAPGQSSPAPTTAWANPTTLSPPTIATLPTVDPDLKKKCLRPRGQFPTSSCNKFINCWDDIILEQECPQGFLFSTKGYCDFPHNVNCGDRKTSSKSADTKAECPVENGTFRDRNQCNSYYTCISNKIVAKYNCPEGFNFNDNIGVCDYANRVDCSKEPLIFPGKRNLTPHKNNENLVITECPVDFGTFRDNKNCSIYYTCISKKIVAKYECPTGFSFNDDIGVCDYSERVDCKLPPKIFQVNPNVLPQMSADFKEKIDRCTPGTLFRLNPQCTSACLCRDGMAEIIQCPAGLAYDSTLDKCVLPHLAKC